MSLAVVTQHRILSLLLWRRTAVVRRRHLAVRTPSCRHRFADFTRRQLFHGLSQLEGRVWPHVNIPGDGPIAFEVQRDGVAPSRGVQSLEDSLQVAANPPLVTTHLH